MSNRRDRWWILGVLVVVIGALTGWEYQRRAQVQPLQPVVQASTVRAAMPSENSVDPAAFAKELRDPKRFQEVLDEVRVHARATSDRDRQLEHVEEQVVYEVDAKGKKVAGERHIEKIWHKDGTKYRQTLEWTDLARNRPKRGAVPTPRKDTGKIDAVFPFERSADQDDYVYQLLGVEKLGDVWTLKVGFSPSGSPKQRFQGEAWINAVDHQPVRLICRTAEKIPFVDQIVTILDYGPVESGGTQLIQTVIEGSGGFAMIQKHYRSEIEFRDYRVSGPTEISPAPANNSR